MSDSPPKARGPLAGVRVVEMAAIGPVPFCGMVLADLGAEVVRIDRVISAHLGIEVDPRFDFIARGKKSIAVDLKQAEGLGIVKRLLKNADVVIEGFRPGVMERLGLAPDACHALNPKLIYARCSGWGDKGPMAAVASHDINYIGMTGALAAMGRDVPPMPPLNLVGDFGGAAMHLVSGILAALLVAQRDGQGQVVSTSIASGAMGLMPMFYGLHAAGDWNLERGTNHLDGGAPYYRTYETSDGRYVAVGAVEQKFYRELLGKMNLNGTLSVDKQNDRATWPKTIEIFAARFKQHPRQHWSDLFAQSDACVTPVLDMSEAPAHPQHLASGAFADVDGAKQPVFGVRFSRNPLKPPGTAPLPGAHTVAVLEKLGYDSSEQALLTRNGVVSIA